MRWRIEKEGYTTGEAALPILSIMWNKAIEKISFTLDQEGSIPPGMVRVTGGMVQSYRANIAVITNRLTDYLIDKYEVTNKQYKEFVAAGGYQKQDYWKHSFIKDGRVLAWAEAMKEFRDATGRPGPSTWELGDYPAGQGDYPVAGVSWYEAAAYAEFAGKSLPTIYHWMGATSIVGRPPLVITPLSNLEGKGPAPVGTYQGIGAFGTYDMAGNVREWCWNESDNGRYIMGGAWNEPAYMYDTADAHLPFDRSPANGFRCVKYLSADALSESVTRPLPLSLRDYSKEKPVSDEVFRIYQSLYTYDRGELNAIIEEVYDSGEYWVRQKISFNAAYGNERVIAYLYLPKNGAPPYQTMVFFPGADTFINRPTPRNLPPYTDLILKSGRAVLLPIYKGIFERNGGFVMAPPYTTASFRDHVIQWSKDLGRSIDYLESRPDIESDKLGYYGLSTGSVAGCVLLALERRIKVGILLSGGLRVYEIHPQADPFNFASRINIPILMINGRYDFVFPFETSQKPLFRLIGTQEKDKRHVTFETQHLLFPRNQLAREVLDWLDHYLEPVD
jgi:formylglycine-generating enzyme required for sulfatase activity